MIDEFHAQIFRLVYAVLIGHFLADFVFQSDWMAKNKSTSNAALSIHIAAYFTVLAAIVWTVALPFQAAITYAGLNSMLHWPTDYATSRITRRLWHKGDVHNFFVVIGLDQLIHYATFLLTAVYMFG